MHLGAGLDTGRCGGFELGVAEEADDDDSEPRLEFAVDDGAEDLAQTVETVRFEIVKHCWHGASGVAVGFGDSAYQCGLG